MNETMLVFAQDLLKFPWVREEFLNCNSFRESYDTFKDRLEGCSFDEYVTFFKELNKKCHELEGLNREISDEDLEGVSAGVSKFIVTSLIALTMFSGLAPVNGAFATGGGAGYDDSSSTLSSASLSSAAELDAEEELKEEWENIVKLYSIAGDHYLRMLPTEATAVKEAYLKIDDNNFDIETPNVDADVVDPRITALKEAYEIEDNIADHKLPTVNEIVNNYKTKERLDEKTDSDALKKHVRAKIFKKVRDLILEAKNEYKALPRAEKGKVSEKILTAKHIYEWIARNIKYDDELADSEGDYRISYREKAGVVFITKSGICTGYSELAVVMMRMAGIPCVRLNSKTHAFNAIYIERAGGKSGWEIMDATWGAGTAMGKDQIDKLSKEELAKQLWQKYSGQICDQARMTGKTAEEILNAYVDNFLTESNKKSLKKSEKKVFEKYFPTYYDKNCKSYNDNDSNNNNNDIFDEYKHRHNNSKNYRIFGFDDEVHDIVAIDDLNYKFKDDGIYVVSSYDVGSFYNKKNDKKFLLNIYTPKKCVSKNIYISKNLSDKAQKYDKKIYIRPNIKSVKLYGDEKIDIQMATELEDIDTSRSSIYDFDKNNRILYYKKGGIAGIAPRNEIAFKFTDEGDETYAENAIYLKGTVGADEDLKYILDDIPAEVKDPKSISETDIPAEVFNSGRPIYIGEGIKSVRLKRDQKINIDDHAKNLESLDITQGSNVYDYDSKTGIYFYKKDVDEHKKGEIAWIKPFEGKLAEKEVKYELYGEDGNIVKITGGGEVKSLEIPDKVFESGKQIRIGGGIKSVKLKGDQKINIDNDAENLESLDIEGLEDTQGSNVYDYDSKTGIYFYKKDVDEHKKGEIAWINPFEGELSENAVGYKWDGVSGNNVIVTGGGEVKNLEIPDKVFKSGKQIWIGDGIKSVKLTGNQEIDITNDAISFEFLDTTDSDIYDFDTESGECFYKNAVKGQYNLAWRTPFNFDAKTGIYFYKEDVDGHKKGEIARIKPFEGELTEKEVKYELYGEDGNTVKITGGGGVENLEIPDKVFESGKQIRIGGGIKSVKLKGDQKIDIDDDAKDLEFIDITQGSNVYDYDSKTGIYFYKKNVYEQNFYPYQVYTSHQKGDVLWIKPKDGVRYDWCDKHKTLKITVDGGKLKDFIIPDLVFNAVDKIYIYIDPSVEVKVTEKQKLILEALLIRGFKKVEVIDKSTQKGPEKSPEK